MQAIYVPKYKIYYRVSPKEPNVLQWSNKPFGPATQWQTAMRFGKPIRALDTDDVTGQGVVVLNDSSTYVGSGVRVWGRKFYPAGTRIYSLYAVGETKEKKAMPRLNIKIHENNDTFLVWSIKFNDSDTASNEEYYLRDAYGSFFATAALGDTVYVKCEPFPGNKFTDDLIEGVIRRWYPKKPIDKITATPEITELFNDIYEKKKALAMNKMKIKIHEALSTIETLFDGDQGCVDINHEYPGIFAYYNLDSESKSDDCTYYFKIDRNKIKPIGFHAGTDEWDPYYFETTHDDWLNEGTGHTKEYRESLLKDLQTLIGKGITY